jgi:hypothetical protein
MAEVEKIAAWLTREGTIHFEIEKGLAGGAAYDAHGSAISDADMGARKPRMPSFWPPSAGRNGMASLTKSAPRRVFCGSARI